MMIIRILNQKYKIFVLSLIFLLGTLIYSNTFYSPFHFDDIHFIANNFLIRDISNLRGIWNFFPGRFIVFITLALNYHFHQLNVFGYHLFNLAIHLGSAILVWWLGMLIFSTPVMEKDGLFKNSKWVALFAALIFLVHPLQTESVTYIWQRCTSLGGFFYLFSICLYIKSRLLWRQNSLFSKRIIVYALSLIFAAMSMFTKENSITLPAMIILSEFCFFKPVKFSSWKYAMPFLFLLPIIPIILSFPQPQSFNTGGHYLLTQFRVVVTYIRLLFIPLNQNLDYDYPVVNSLINLPALISFVFLVVIIVSAILVFYKYRLVSFGILWFFLTLSPDSSFVPLDDVIFEHRLYLPIVGSSFAVVSFIYYFFKHKTLKLMVVALLVIISCYAMLTYRRNFIWKDKITLLNDVIRKSPMKARSYNNRGNAYKEQGNIQQAISDYTKGIAINPRDAEIYSNRGSAYKDQGNIQQALSDYNKAIEINPHFFVAYDNRGITYYQQGNFIQAISNYNKAIAINSDYAGAYYNRGTAYVKQGNFVQAISDYTKAIAINSRYAEAYNNRGGAYYVIKEYDQAWVDVHKAEGLGYLVHPGFLAALKKASAREK